MNLVPEGAAIQRVCRRLRVEDVDEHAVVERAKLVKVATVDIAAEVALQSTFDLFERERAECWKGGAITKIKYRDT